MKGNFHVRFLEEGKGAISSSYSAIKRIYTDTIYRVFRDQSKRRQKNAYGELTPRNILIRNPKSVRIRRICGIRVPFDLMNTISSIQTTMPITQFCPYPAVKFSLTDGIWISIYLSSTKI